MLVYCAFENDNLVSLEPSPFIGSYSMDVYGEAYTSAKQMFNAGFVHNALILLVFGCKRLPSGNEIASAHRKAEKYAVNPIIVKIRRKDGIIVNVFDRLSYKETQAIKKEETHELFAIYCLDDLDVYGQHYTALDRNGILSILL